MMSASEIYTVIAIARKDVAEEIEDEQSLYIEYFLKILQTFKGNAFLADAIAYIQKYFLAFMEETTFEQETYNRVIAFFDELPIESDLDEYKNESILTLLTSILDYFDASCENRLVAVSGLTAFLDIYIEEGYMDGTNFEYPLYDRTNMMSAEDRKKILELFPNTEK